MMNMKSTWAALALCMALAGCGGGGDGPAVRAESQSIDVAAVPSQELGGALSLGASASSGLPVSYSSATPTVCTVSAAGLVTTLAGGTCELVLRQDGNADHAPAAPVTVQFEVTVDPRQTLLFAPAPTLTLGGTATVLASSSAGLAVVYSSLTPEVCGVNAQGLVSSLGTGTCTIAADQPGDARHQAAEPVTISLDVVIPPGITVPGAPAGVTVRLASQPGQVSVAVTGTDSGGTPITAYQVRSQPARVAVTVPALPASVPCDGDCAGLSFTVAAVNALGEGAASTLTQVITPMRVALTFHEPDTQPKDTQFEGSFSYNSSTGAVSGLSGRLSESMTGDGVDSMVWLDLTHQLITWRDEALGGRFAAVFRNASTRTFCWTALCDSPPDDWSPATGVAVGGIHAGFPSASANPGNAYVLIFVPDQPLAALSQAQLDKLAYADCVPLQGPGGLNGGGMMGAVCMTGTSVAGYGALGTMSGHPVSQRITVAAP